MPLKRSRPLTEEKFQNAAIALIAEAGCGAVGINAVAQRAGADKVLIYRYFGDLDGLWQRVAESRLWLPESESLLKSLHSSRDPIDVLKSIIKELTYWLQRDPACRQLIAWRRAVRNPLTDHFAEQWALLWSEITQTLSTGLSFEQRRYWSNACSLAALVVEAEVCGESIDTHCIEQLASVLEPGEPGTQSGSSSAVDTLPTNLL